MVYPGPETVALIKRWPTGCDEGRHSGLPNQGRMGHPGLEFDCPDKGCHPIGLIYESKFWPLLGHGGIHAFRLFGPLWCPELVTSIRHKIALLGSGSYHRLVAIRVEGMDKWAKGLPSRAWGEGSDGGSVLHNFRRDFGTLRVCTKFGRVLNPQAPSR